MSKRLSLAIAGVATLLLAGCGGGGAGFVSMSLGDVSGAGMIIGSSVPGALSGSVVKGPVSGATVRAFAVTGGAMGAQIATASTDASGNFTMPMGDYAGAVMLQASGGSYADEASGMPMAMGSGDVMTAVLPSFNAGSGVSGVAVTPLTAMAQAMAGHMAGGLTDSNIAAANAAVGNYYLVHDILHTQPMNALVPGSAAGATADMRNYGITLAAMSQYAHGAGTAGSSSFVTAMMTDASDGVIDGKAAGVAVTFPGTAGGGMLGGGATGGGMMAPDAGGAGLATAMRDFMASSQNRSGLSATDMATLMQRLRDGTGQLR